MNPLAERLLILLLAVLAAGTGWWLWHLQERVLDAEPARFPELDYILEDFALVAYNERGLNSFRLEAPRLERVAESGELRVVAPRIAMRDGNGRHWHAEARVGTVSPKGEVVELSGGVDLERAESDLAPLRLRSEHLTFVIAARRLETKDWVTIEQPGSILRGRGLVAELDADRLQLLADVHATFQPVGR